MTSKEAIHAPSRPSLDDDRQPTNPELWRKVLDVASGERKTYTGIGGRTIQSPNRGRGYRNMPHNPMGIAWSVKQYNAFGGGWTPKREACEQALPYHTVWLTSPQTFAPFRVAGLGRVQPEAAQRGLGGWVQDLQFRTFTGAMQVQRDTLDLRVEAAEKTIQVTGLLASQGVPLPLQTITANQLTEAIFRATGDRVARLALGLTEPVGGGIQVKYATMCGTGTIRATLVAVQQDGRTGLVPTLTCLPDACQIPVLAAKVAERYIRDV